MATGELPIGMAPPIASSRVAAIALVLELEIGRVAVLALAAEPLAIGQAAARARAIVRGAAPMLAIVPGVVPELAIDLAEVQAPVIVLAEVREPETVQVEGVPVRNHLHARLAVPLRTKWVIAVHHRGRVPLLTVEDLAAEVVETTLEQAAAEAVTAWEAAE